jgi:hypothetical protein
VTVALADEPDDAEDPSARWTPDEQLIERALVVSPGLRMRELSEPDRCWVVAGLRRRGLTAERIADLLHCALRTVRATLAEPATILAALYMVERETFADEHRMTASEVARLAAELTDAQGMADRYKLQLDRLIELHIMPSEFRCGCPRDRYNSYVDPKTGKTSCRKHRRLAVARHRARKKQSGAQS